MLGEVDARAEDKILDGAGDEDLRGGGQGSDAGGDVHGHADHLLPVGANLTGVETEAEFKSDLGRSVP